METSIPFLRNSERQDFKTCVAKWDWRWNQQLVPINQPIGALWYGTIWHLFWATVYTPPGKDGFERSITNPVEIHQLWDQLANKSYAIVSCGSFFGEDDEKEYWDAITLGHVMIDGQLKQWNLDPAWEVIMPEQRFGMMVKFTEDQRTRFELPENPQVITDKFITKIVGTFDLPVRDHSDGRGRVWIVDWKTTAMRRNLKQANKDDQLGTYIAVATTTLRRMGLIGADEAVAGGMWSFARKAKPPNNVDEDGRVRNKPQRKHYLEAIEQEYVRENGEGSWANQAIMTGKEKLDELQFIADALDLTVYGDISKNQGAPLFWREVVTRNKANRQNTIKRIAEDAEVMAFIRDGQLPIMKSPGDHCNWCPFTDLCDIDEDGGDTQAYIDTVFKREDPYADHRENADNSKQSLLTRKD